MDVSNKKLQKTLLLHSLTFMYRITHILYFALIFCSLQLSAISPCHAQTDATMQAIAGVWKGSFYVDSTKKTFDYELSISNEKGKSAGYSRLAFEDEKGIMQVVYRDHSIAINGNEIIIKDEKQLTKASSIEQPKELLKIMTLILSTTDTELQLRGGWVTNKTRRFFVATGTAELSKKLEYTETALFKKLEELGLSTQLSYNVPEVALASSIAKAQTITLTKSAGNLKGTPPPAVEVTYPSSIVFTESALPAATPPEVIIVTPKEKPPNQLLMGTVVKLEKTATAKIIAPVIAAVPPPKSKAPATVAAATVQKPAPTVTVAASPQLITATSKIVLPTRPAVLLAPTVNAAKDVAQRSIASTQTVFYKSDSIGITLYDNGEIDGDTVSVLLNGKVIIARQGLNTQPNVYRIYIDPNTPDTMTLVMYAENLGSIPPNTGLMVVRDGASIYEVRFSADLKNNAAIILRRRKTE